MKVGLKGSKSTGGRFTRAMSECKWVRVIRYPPLPIGRRKHRQRRSFVYGAVKKKKNISEDEGLLVHISDTTEYLDQLAIG